jgi:hypothetical protein
MFDKLQLVALIERGPNDKLKSLSDRPGQATARRSLAFEDRFTFFQKRARALADIIRFKQT